MNIGETMQLGVYTVRCWLRPDNPAFPCYLIFKAAELIGKQFSVPCETDCRWHEMRKGEYAKAEESKRDSRWQLNIQPPKRGRPSNAERARRAQLAAMEEEALKALA